VVEFVLEAAQVSLQDRTYADIIAGRVMEDDEPDEEGSAGEDLPSGGGAG